MIVKFVSRLDSVDRFYTQQVAYDINTLPQQDLFNLVLHNLNYICTRSNDVKCQFCSNRFDSMVSCAKQVNVIEEDDMIVVRDQPMPFCMSCRHEVLEELKTVYNFGMKSSYMHVVSRWVRAEEVVANQTDQTTMD